jgi:hypothetical protein
MFTVTSTLNEVPSIYVGRYGNTSRYRTLGLHRV